MDAVAAEVERASLVDLRLAGGFYLIIRDEGEGIHCCRIHADIYPKLYGDIVFRALQRAAVIAKREEEEEEAAVRGKGVSEGAEAVP